MANVFLDPPPGASIYGNIFAALGEFDKRIEYNGFSPALIQAYPFLLESWYDTELVMLRGLDYLTTLRTTFPRLAHLTSAGRNNLNRFPSSIIDAFNDIRTQMQAEKYVSLRSGTVGQLWSGPDTDLATTYGKSFPAPSAMLATNTSQFHRDRQVAYAPQAVANLRMLAEFLNGEMVRLSNQHSRAHWSLRPPHTFNSNVISDLAKISEAYFNNIEYYLTDAQNRIIATLRKANLYDQLFHMRAEDAESLFPPQQEYFRWWKMVATAVFTHPHLPITIAIIPDGVPPFMFRNPNFTVPFYAGAPFDPLCIADSCYLIWNLSTTDMDYNAALIHDSNIEGYMTELRMIGAAMQLAVMNLHILCAAIPVGRGNRKPQWLQSPANAAFVKITQLATRNFAETLTLFGIDRVKPSTSNPVL